MARVGRVVEGETSPLAMEEEEDGSLLLVEPLPDPENWTGLVLLGLVPFGGHCFKSAMSGLQPLLALTAAQQGLLYSAFALPNATIAPIIGGLIFDSPRAHKHAITWFALCACAGGVVCATGLAVEATDVAALTLTYVGGTVLGLGQGCLVVGSRAAASSYAHVTFAQGILAGVANLASFAAKSLAAPLADRTSVALALAVLVLCQVASFVAALLQPSVAFPASTYSWRNRRGGLTLRKICCARCAFLKSDSFWAVAVAHAAAVVGFKVFENNSSVILVAAYGYDAEKAGVVASFIPLASVVLAPAVGFASDQLRTSWALIALAVLAAATGFGFFAFGPHLVPEAVPVLLVALSHAVLPTLLLSRIPRTVDGASLGVAFGICEILVAFGNVLAHPAFGVISDCLRQPTTDGIITNYHNRTFSIHVT